MERENVRFVTSTCQFINEESFIVFVNSTSFDFVLYILSCIVSFQAPSFSQVNGVGAADVFH